MQNNTLVYPFNVNKDYSKHYTPTILYLHVETGFYLLCDIAVFAVEGHSLLETSIHRDKSC